MCDKYNFLEGLIGPTFYQCWAEVDEREPDEILNDAINLSKDLHLKNILKELDYIFLKIDQNNKLEKLIASQFDCNYDPQDDNKSYIEWLVEIKQKIHTHLSKQENQEVDS